MGRVSTTWCLMTPNSNLRGKVSSTSISPVPSCPTELHQQMSIQEKDYVTDLRIVMSNDSLFSKKYSKHHE